MLTHVMWASAAVDMFVTGLQVCDRGAGSALLLKPRRIEEIAKAADRSMSLPLTLKTRKGYYDDQDVRRARLGRDSEGVGA